MATRKTSRDYVVLARQLAELAVESPDLLPAVTAILGHLAKEAGRDAPCKHGRDFASVVWHSKNYVFGATQARIVRVLWEAWEAGTPEVRQETLLMEADSECDRLCDVFKGNTAWGAMIVPGPVRGTFRLADPENPG